VLAMELDGWGWWGDEVVGVGDLRVRRRGDEADSESGELECRAHWLDKTKALNAKVATGAKVREGKRYY
jgi:hypothetical protein